MPASRRQPESPRPAAEHGAGQTPSRPSAPAKAVARRPHLALARHLELFRLSQHPAAALALAAAVAAGPAAQAGGAGAALARAAAARTAAATRALPIRLPVIHKVLCVRVACCCRRPRCCCCCCAYTPGAGRTHAPAAAAQQLLLGSGDAALLALQQLRLPLALLPLPKAPHPVGSVVVIRLASPALAAAASCGLLRAAAAGGRLGRLAPPLVLQPLQAGADQAQRLAGACGGVWDVQDMQSAFGIGLEPSWRGTAADRRRAGQARVERQPHLWGSRTGPPRRRPAPSTGRS